LGDSRGRDGIGDSFEETARKELFEETGLTAKSLELLTLVSGKEFYYQFPHGDEIYNTTAVYKAVDIEGILKKDGESLELAYFPLHSLPSLNSTARKLLEKTGYI
jgi:8-oxo-dGTP pyrophosphatase MutT (NUDIX family)